VSRIEFTVYHYSVSGLCIQIDATINPGNSGGPTVGDKMIELAFARHDGHLERQIHPVNRFSGLLVRLTA